MIPTISSSQLKQQASAALSGHWGLAILACFIFSFFSNIYTNSYRIKSGAQSGSDDVESARSILENIPTTVILIFCVICFILWLLNGPIQFGYTKIFLSLSDRKSDVRLGNILDGFQNFGSNIVLSIVSNIFLILWTCLFVIPGIIKVFSYSMIFYIKNDIPELSAIDAITLSRRLMDGYKMKLFYLYLSFIGWMILSVFTCGILFILYVQPKMEASTAEFYNYYIRPRLNEYV